MLLSKHSLFLIGICFLLAAACGESAPVEEVPASPTPSTYIPGGKIIVDDPSLAAIIPIDSSLEVIARGYVWSEGPLWLPDQQMLIWSDVPENTVYGWAPGGEAQPFLSPSGYTQATERGGELGSNGLALDNQGRLLLCQHGNRQIARMEALMDIPQPIFASLASRYEGKRFNSPNDLAVSRSGSIFFTDPPYGLLTQMDDPAKEIAFQGVYRLDPNGEVTLITDKLSRPNGIALSPDEKVLYVANSDPERAIWMAYYLDKKGDALSERVLYDATAEVGEANPGLPDGLKVDRHGHIFATGPGGVMIFSSGGKRLGRIQTGLPTSNCAFGAGDFYMTADSLILRLPFPESFTE